jgi:hypothetical protein
MYHLGASQCTTYSIAMKVTVIQLISYTTNWFISDAVSQLLNILYALINLLKTKRNLLYIRNHSVPRCKQFPPRL